MAQSSLWLEILRVSILAAEFGVVLSSSVTFGRVVTVLSE